MENMWNALANEMNSESRAGDAGENVNGWRTSAGFLQGLSFGAQCRKRSWHRAWRNCRSGEGPLKHRPEWLDIVRKIEYHHPL